MADPTAQRLAELIWRTVKLRVWLLSLTILGLLVVWSAVLSGNQRAKSVDVAFCSRLISDSNEQFQTMNWKSGLAGPYLLLDPVTGCTGQVARTFIEAQRNLNEIVTHALGNVPNKTLEDIYDKKKRNFAEYDSDRRDAYSLQIELSSIATSTVTVNALSVAEIAPFVALIAFSLAVLWGFQQKLFRSELAVLIGRSGDNASLAVASTQFFAVPRAITSHWFFLSPERLAIWALTGLAIFSLFGVLTAFIVNVIHLTDSILVSYTSLLFGATFALASLLIATRRSLRLLSATPTTRHDQGRSGWLVWLEGAAVGTAFTSLFLPWTIEFGRIPTLHGYQFVVRQTSLTLLSGLSSYPIAPKLYRQLWPQVDIALLFVVICAVHLVARSGKWVRMVLFAKIRAAFALIVLYLSLNFLLYMGVLEYEALTGSTWDFVNQLSLANVTTGATGLPMTFYDPSYGFIAFLFACFVLVWFSIDAYLDASRS